MTKIFYYKNNDRQFDTVAKINDVVTELQEQGLSHLVHEVEQMLPQTLEDFLNTDYVQALTRGMPRILSESSGLRWSPAYRASIFGMAQAMMAATWHAVNTGADAFALTAGAHHARPSAGAGFCAINSLAIAALSVVRNNDRHVYILDVDSHAGGGTNAFIKAEDNERLHHLDLVVSPFDRYRSTRRQDNMVMADSLQRYMPSLRTMLSEASANDAPRPGDILLVNAGVDVHEDSDIGALEGMDYDGIVTRERIIRDWAKQHKMHVVGLLAGGYSGASLSAQQLAIVHTASIRSLLAV